MMMEGGGGGSTILRVFLFGIECVFDGCASWGVWRAPWGRVQGPGAVELCVLLAPAVLARELYGSFLWVASATLHRAVSSTIQTRTSVRARLPAHEQ